MGKHEAAIQRKRGLYEHELSNYAYKYYNTIPKSILKALRNPIEGETEFERQKRKDKLERTGKLYNFWSMTIEQKMECVNKLIQKKKEEGFVDNGRILGLNYNPACKVHLEGKYHYTPDGRDTYEFPQRRKYSYVVSAYDALANAYLEDVFNGKTIKWDEKIKIVGEGYYEKDEVIITNYGKLLEPEVGFKTEPSF